MGNIDLDKFRLRRFVERLIDMGEMEVRDEPVPLTRLSEIIESTPKGVLFRQAGPEKLEVAAKVAGGRARLAAAFDTTLDKLYHRRLATPQETVQKTLGQTGGLLAFSWKDADRSALLRWSEGT